MFRLYRLFGLALLPVLFAACEKVDITTEATPVHSAGRIEVTPSYRGVYVNAFDTMLGNVAAEDSMLNWCKTNGFNAISLYSLNAVMGDERYTSLARFIKKARTGGYGITQVAAVRGSSNNFTQNANYDNGRADLNERFNVYNLENEWWNNGPDCPFGCYTNILQFMSQKALAANPKIIRETYMGWFQNPDGNELNQAKTLVKNLDRLMVHDYRTSPSFGYMQSRLSYVGRAAKSLGRVMDVIVIFSAEPEFMQNYFSTSGQNKTFDDAYAAIVAQHDAATFTGKENIRIIGYQIFQYSLAKQARPLVMPVLQ
jgi:hypothetical protein